MTRAAIACAARRWGITGMRSAFAASTRRARRRLAFSRERNGLRDIVQRGGEVVLTTPANVKQATIKPFITRHVAVGALIHAEEYDIYAAFPHGDTVTKLSATATANTLATRTATASMKFTSTRSRDSGRCSGRGCGPTAASHRRNFPFTWHSSSSSTTRESVARRCRPPSSNLSSPPQSSPRIETVFGIPKPRAPFKPSPRNTS